LLSVSDLPVQAEIHSEAPPSTPLPTQDDPTPPAPEPLRNEPGATRVQQLPLARITPNPHQPRRVWDEARIAELSASIRSSGIIQPIVVRRLSDSSYELIAGERRLRAAKLAGLETVPAIVRDANAFEQAQLALIENIQREDLNPIDRAAGYRLLIEKLGLTQAELASRLGEDRSGIANHLRLLDLTEPVRDLIRAGRISLGHAKLLAGITDPAEQERLANLAVTQDLSVRNLERAMASPANDEAPATRSPAPASAHLTEVERAIARKLSMRVQLRAGSKGKGRLVIHYANLDEFDTLLAMLEVKLDD
jgi:ParB family chromosome partitioning protein